MQAFISYSHYDSVMLELLQKHLIQLQRDGLITTWTDHEIHVGGELDRQINSALSNAGIFIALLSPDYIASKYCFEKEFETAMERQKKGELIIVPVIIEPCDWHNTPFKDFKALPRDGKPVSTWENKNTAFLDVSQNIRRLLEAPHGVPGSFEKANHHSLPSTRNYRIQKDFDSIEKLKFLEKTFGEIKSYLTRYIGEVVGLENIKAQTLKETDKEYECIVVNRNKINTESRLKITINSEQSGMQFFPNSTIRINFAVGSSNQQSPKSFGLNFDEYHLFWSESSWYSGNQNKEFDSKEIADVMWNELLESVGIL